MFLLNKVLDHEQGKVNWKLNKLPYWELNWEGDDQDPSAEVRSMEISEGLGQGSLRLRALLGIFVRCTLDFMSGHQHFLFAWGEPGPFGKDSEDSSAGLALAI